MRIVDKPNPLWFISTSTVYCITCAWSEKGNELSLPNAITTTGVELHFSLGNFPWKMMYWQILFVVFIWMVDVISERHFINAFHNNDGASSCLMRRQRQQQQQQLSLRRNIALEILPVKHHLATQTKTTLSVLPLRREIFITNRWKRHHRHNIRLQAIHEPQSDSTSSKSLSHWSPSSLFQSLRIKDRNQLSSLISASVIIGLSSYYFYKGIYSISSSVSFWKAEGDLILKPLSVATWSAELIGYDISVTNFPPVAVNI